jgi:hypothetical protein
VSFFLTSYIIREKEKMVTKFDKENDVGRSKLLNMVVYNYSYYAAENTHYDTQASMLKRMIVYSISYYRS